MVIAEVKPLAEIMELIKPYKKVLNAGCGGCVAVCLGGGQKEVDTLNTKIELSCREQKIPLEISGFTVERQCDMQFNAELDHLVGGLRCTAFHGLRRWHSIPCRALSGQAGTAGS